MFAHDLKFNFTRLIGGKALSWDATCTDLFSASNLCSIILNPASTASSAEMDLKRKQYSQIVASFEFVPVGVETSAGSAGCSLLTDFEGHQ